MNELTETLAAELIDACRERGIFVATVESCTGGLLARLITRVPGSSAAYWGSLITYDNSAKVALAGVDAALIDLHGAVSSEVARAMAEGGLRAMRRAMTNSKGFACVSTTGVAGPGGGSAQKPVGLCQIAVALFAGGVATTTHFEFQASDGSDRAKNQNAFAHAALEFLLNRIKTG
jgi:nicotinamide-nucleotide amidase